MGTSQILESYLDPGVIMQKRITHLAHLWAWGGCFTYFWGLGFVDSVDSENPA